MVYKILFECYPKVLKKLSLRGNISSTVHIAGCLNHAISGSISANFFADTWPDFSAIVCQLLSPCLSGSWDLFCHSTSSELLWEILKQEKLITLEKSQTIIVSEAFVGIDLSKMLSLRLKASVSVDKYGIIYLPDAPTPSLLNVKCPDGYKIQELKVEHAEFLEPHWSYFTAMPNRISTIQECIKRFSSAAVFSDDNKYQPVSWVLQYHYGEIGMLGTIECHRRKGLGSVVLAALCRSIQHRSPTTPFAGVSDGSQSVVLLKRLGFVSDDVEFCCVETKS